MSSRLIFIASYPKSGNTWLRAMLAAFLNGGASLDINDIGLGRHAAARDWIDRLSGLRSADLAPDLADIVRRETLASLGRAEGPPIFLKTHDANLRLPDGGQLHDPAAIRLVLSPVRHPYDVALSLADHLGLSHDLAAIVDFMCDPEARLPDRFGDRFRQILQGWSSNIRSWTEGPAPVMILRYEDMLAAPLEVLCAVVTRLWPEAQPDEAILRSVVELTRFARFRRLEAEHSFIERPSTSDRFFRTGRAGAGVETIPPALLDRLWRAHAPMMAQLGYNRDGTARALPLPR